MSYIGLAPLLLAQVPESCQGERLDVALFRLFEAVTSRSVAGRLVDGGYVSVQLGTGGAFLPSGRVKASYKVEAGQILSLPESVFAPPNAPPQPQKIPLQVLFEDSDILVVNKPAGMVVHPGAGVRDGCLVNAVLAHCGGATLPTLGGPERAGIVHRLDRDTSGVMVVAKSQRALTALAAQFASHAQERVYDALVYGTAPASAVVETPHGRHPRDRLRYAVLPEGEGKTAKMEIARKEDYVGLASWVECRLHTGRTHQIRVQMTHLGHGLLGDLLYRAIPSSSHSQKGFVEWVQKQATRQMLHARLLGLTHPVTGEPMRFVSPPPPDFQSVVQGICEWKTRATKPNH